MRRDPRQLRILVPVESIDERQLFQRRNDRVAGWSCARELRGAAALRWVLGGEERCPKRFSWCVLMDARAFSTPAFSPYVKDDLMHVLYALRMLLLFESGCWITSLLHSLSPTSCSLQPRKVWHFEGRYHPASFISLSS